MFTAYGQDYRRITDGLRQDYGFQIKVETDTKTIAHGNRRYCDGWYHEPRSLIPTKTWPDMNHLGQ